MIRFDGITIDRHRRAIENAGAVCFVPGSVMFRVACALLLAGPRTVSELINIVYRDDDGGPLDARGTIDVMIHTLRPRFAGIGIDMRSERGAGRKKYWAEPPSLPQNLEAAE